MGIDQRKFSLQCCRGRRMAKMSKKHGCRSMMRCRTGRCDNWSSYWFEKHNDERKRRQQLWYETFLAKLREKFDA